MASRHVLVMVNGKIQQMQAGDTIADPVSEQEMVTQTADADLIAGEAVYSSAADHVNKAKADAIGTVKLMGFANAAISNGATGTVKTSGILTLTTGQWDALAGTTGGLTFNTDYYLSPATAGLLTATAPTTVGQYVVLAGRAISTTEMRILITDYVLL